MYRCPLFTNCAYVVAEEASKFIVVQALYFGFHCSATEVTIFWFKPRFCFYSDTQEATQCTTVAGIVRWVQQKMYVHVCVCVCCVFGVCVCMRVCCVCVVCAAFVLYICVCMCVEGEEKSMWCSCMRV